MNCIVQLLHRRAGPILVLSALAFLAASTPSHAQFVDSLWLVGAEGDPGDLVQVEVWLQYEGGGAGDSISSFDIPLTWDAAVCTVESFTIGTDFIDGAGLDWIDQSRVDNDGTQGPPAQTKLSFSCFTFGPPIGAPFVDRGTHLVATVDFRILDTASPGSSAYIDTLLEAFSPPVYLGFVDRGGIATYLPTYAGASVVVPLPPGDVGPTSIDSPPDSVNVNANYAPSAWVTNFGADAAGPVPVICTIDGWADTIEIASIPGGDSAAASFSNWMAASEGTYTVTFFTEFSADTNTTNDTIMKTVDAYRLSPDGDVGPVSITSPPDTVYVGNAYAPQAIVENFGVDTAGPVPVICMIDGWADTMEVLAIAGAESAIVDFADWTVMDTGTYWVTVFTQYPTDTMMTNDTLTMSILAMAAPGDVGPVSIISPPDTVISGSSYAPSAWVMNYGADPVGPIPVVCNIDGWSDTTEIAYIAGMDSMAATFASWMVPDSLVYSVTIFTEYPEDTVAANDTIMKTVQGVEAAIDVGPSMITSPPDSVYSTFSYAPAAWVVNYGADPTDTFPVICMIDGWADTVDVPTIPGMDSLSVTFADWMVPDTGSYTVTVYTEYPPDVNTSNDTTSKMVYASVAPVQYSDSLWLVGGAADAGQIVPVEVWIQYNGDGTLDDSINAFNVTLIWDTQICTVEAITIEGDFAAWQDVSKIDNLGADGPPAGVPKIGVFAFTFGPPIGAPFVERGTHLAATVDFRILGTVSDDSTYIDTLLQAWSPPVWTEFIDKYGIDSYTPTYEGAWVIANRMPWVEETIVQPPVPSVHGVSQSYPNPMRTTMSISYQIAKRCPVTLDIFDNSGRLVRSLVETEMEPGYYTASWNGEDESGQDIANGIYFYRLKAGDYTQTRKFVKVK